MKYLTFFPFWVLNCCLNQTIRHLCSLCLYSLSSAIHELIYVFSVSVAVMYWTWDCDDEHHFSVDQGETDVFFNVTSLIGVLYGGICALHSHVVFFTVDTQIKDCSIEVSGAQVCMWGTAFLQTSSFYSRKYTVHEDGSTWSKMSPTWIEKERGVLILAHRPIQDLWQ